MAHNVLFPQQNGQEYYPVQTNDLNFQQFSYGSDYGQQGMAAAPSYDASATMRPQIPTEVTFESIKRAFSTGGFDNEPPLLEGSADVHLR